MKKRIAAGLAALIMGSAVPAAALPVQALSLGNVNGDGAVNASDAAVVLIASAAMGAGRSSGLSSAQLQAANVNGDSAVNASDAAVILIYAAAAGAGNSQTLEEYLASQGQGKTQFRQYADEVVRLVNAERKKAGLDPLYAAPVLNRAAQIRAEECTIRIDETHKRPDGRDWNTALAEVGVTNVTCGENVAMGFGSPERVVSGWMSSGSHKANILSKDFTCIGVGVAEKDGYLYWAQEFTGGATFDGAYLP